MEEYIFNTKEEAEKVIKEELKYYYSLKEMHDRTKSMGLVRATGGEASYIIDEIKEICKLNKLKFEDYVK